MKYKPCCYIRCLVHGCKVKEEGGCYCLCRMFDHISSLESIQKGNIILDGIVSIYYPDKEKAKKHFDRLSDEDKKRNLDAISSAQENIEKIKEKIKTFEAVDGRDIS